MWNDPEGHQVSVFSDLMNVSMLCSVKYQPDCSSENTVFHGMHVLTVTVTLS